MRLFTFMLLGLGLNFGAIARAADAPKVATLDVSIENKDLVTKAAGIQTLFVVVYDLDSPQKMPYGAMKIDLKSVAKGSIYKGDLTADNFTVMGPKGNPFPKNFKMKVRLDKDGVAGMDQAGDLVGIVEKTKIGDKVNVVINSAI